MDIEQINMLVDEYNQSNHGASGYDEDKIFVYAGEKKDYIPISFLKKRTINWWANII